MDLFKERLKPLNEEKQEILDCIKKGSEFVKDEECKYQMKNAPHTN